MKKFLFLASLSFLFIANIAQAKTPKDEVLTSFNKFLNADRFHVSIHNEVVSATTPKSNKNNQVLKDYQIFGNKKEAIVDNADEKNLKSSVVYEEYVKIGKDGKENYSVSTIASSIFLENFNYNFSEIKSANASDSFPGQWHKVSVLPAERTKLKPISAFNNNDYIAYLIKNGGSNVMVKKLANQKIKGQIAAHYQIIFKKDIFKNKVSSFTTYEDSNVEDFNKFVKYFSVPYNSFTFDIWVKKNSGELIKTELSLKYEVNNKTFKDSYIAKYVVDYLSINQPIEIKLPVDYVDVSAE